MARLRRDMVDVLDHRRGDGRRRLGHRRTAGSHERAWRSASISAPPACAIAAHRARRRAHRHEPGGDDAPHADFGRRYGRIRTIWSAAVDEALLELMLEARRRTGAGAGDRRHIGHHPSGRRSTATPLGLASMYNDCAEPADLARVTAAAPRTRRRAAARRRWRARSTMQAIAEACTHPASGRLDRRTILRPLRCQR